MEKTLNQKIYEVPLDIKQAIYDRGYEAGRQSMLEQEEATWLPKNFTSFDIEKIGFNCSKCNTTWDVPTNYCPHCGAKMIKEA